MSRANHIVEVPMAQGMLPAATDPVLTHKITLSFGSSRTDNNPVAMEVSLAELKTHWSVPDTSRGSLSFAAYHALRKDDPEEKERRASEKDGLYFVAATFGDRGGRVQENVESMTGFTLDFDSGKTTLPVIQDRLKGLAYLAYPSYSHKPGDEHWRVFVPYREPISSDRHRAIYEYFNARFDGDLDPSCKKPAQIYYTPACPKDAVENYQLVWQSGSLFDPGTVSVAAAARKPPSPTQAANTAEYDGDQMERLVVAIRYLDPDSREAWIDAGMAIKHDLGEAGRELWIEWSKASPKFDEDDAVRTWESLNPKTGPGAITLGTIFHKAKEAGWNPAGGREPVPAEILELNATYFLAPYGGKVPVFREFTDPTFGATMVEPMQAHDFMRLHSNRKVRVPVDKGKFKSIPLGEFWLDHPERRQYNGVIFSPGDDKPGYFNRWRGFAVRPVPGSWALMQQHILTVLCRGDQRLYEYVLNWLARAVQKPSEPGQVAIVLRGGQGTGKGLFAREFGRLFGPHFMQIAQARHLTGNFNGHFECTVVLFVDEGFWAGDKQGEGALKNLVTEPFITTERKGYQAQTSKNCLHLLIASNNDWVVPADADDRRFCVLDVDDARAQDPSYFDPIYAEMNNGGREAMLDDLLARDISQFDVSKVPTTKAKLDQKLLSLDPFEKWWLSKLVDGEFLEWDKSGAAPWGSVPTSIVQADYEAAMKSMGISRKLTTAELGKKLAAAMPPGTTLTTRQTANGKQVRYYAFPPLVDCRTHFERRLKMVGAIDWNTGAPI